MNSERNNCNIMKKKKNKNKKYSECALISIKYASQKYFKKLLGKNNNEIKKEVKYNENSISSYNNIKCNNLDNYAKKNIIKPLRLNKSENHLSSIMPISKIKKRIKDNNIFCNNKIIINPLTFNKIKDIDIRTKLIELGEKIERSEKNIKIIKNSNEKLLEILKNFKFITKDFNNYSNSEENSLKKIPSKKIFYSPSTNKINNTNKNKLKILNENNQKSIHKKSNSFSKLKIFLDSNKKNNNNSNRYDKNKSYTPSKLNTYKQLYNRDKHKVKKRINSKIYVYKKNKSNKLPLIRKTIFLTGYSNETDRNIYYDNYNNNIINSARLLNEMESNNSIYNNQFNNYSFPTLRQYDNNSMIINSSEIGNIYQRQIMKLPPHNQPLFYESNNNCISTILSEYNNSVKNKIII
jgi:hypothetical protein